MEIFWPAPQDHDTCALCNRVVDQSTDYVLTWDEAGKTLWWHMTCRDRMIPVLLAERDEVDARDEEI